MAGRPPFDQMQLGQRIADGRIEGGLKQADLAAAVGLDRTAVAKIEAGTRKVSAVELAKIAVELERPLDWFLVESPQAVVSRRTDAGAGRRTIKLDRALEKAARDIEFLLEAGVLEPSSKDIELAPPRSSNEAEQLAEPVHTTQGQERDPLLALDQAAEQLGLLCFRSEEHTSELQSRRDL